MGEVEEVGKWGLRDRALKCEKSWGGRVKR